ncbi:hypothetical protein FWH13_00925 [Candidatus Saccharibacteria bacterium]|nr:hypothetical protein [Candidatus Saccharibacteria bacterium]
MKKFLNWLRSPIYRLANINLGLTLLFAIVGFGPWFVPGLITFEPTLSLWAYVSFTAMFLAGIGATQFVWTYCVACEQEGQAAADARYYAYLDRFMERNRVVPKVTVYHSNGVWQFTGTAEECAVIAKDW